MPRWSPPRHSVGVIRRRRSPRQVRSEGKTQELLDVVQLHAHTYEFSCLVLRRAAASLILPQIW